MQIYRKGVVDMKSSLLNLFAKFSTVFAALALTITSVNINSCCFWINNQPELPADAKKLRKF